MSLERLTSRLEHLLRKKPQVLWEGGLPQIRARSRRLSSFHPVLMLHVTYTVPTTGNSKAVSPIGRNFTPQAAETFVVAMLDPDAPTPQDPTHAQVRHFLGGFTLSGSPSERAPRAPGRSWRTTHLHRATTGSPPRTIYLIPTGIHSFFTVNLLTSRPPSVQYHGV